MASRTEIVIALLVFSVPLVALLTEHRQKMKKLVTMDEWSPQLRVEDDAVVEEPAFKMAADRNRAQR